jgi:hypothetical protein
VNNASNIPASPFTFQIDRAVGRYLQKASSDQSASRAANRPLSNSSDVVKHSPERVVALK